MSRRGGGWVPVGLIALVAIPVLAGTARLVEILGGPELIPADARFAAAPAPVVVHVLASIGFALLGAFQFSPGIRQRHPDWHRRAGRILVGLGLAVALTGLWMTLSFPQKVGTGDILFATRLVVSSAMAVSLVLGVLAIKRRNVKQHRAQMMRAYALALGAGTQAFTVGFGGALFGSGIVRRDLMMAAGWVINLAIAEMLIRRTSARRGRPRVRTTMAGVR
jgi:uncharacterized membrane protein